MVTSVSAARHAPYEAVPIRLRVGDAVSGDIAIYLIGCGGTGGWLAPHLARRAWQLNRVWNRLAGGGKRQVTLAFVDPDGVETKNVEARQNFIPCDVSHAKARVLATRYALAYDGLRIEAKVDRFDPAWVQPYGNTTVVLVDALDNAAGRLAIHSALAHNVGKPWPRVWWLSSGNGRSSGQVCLGNTTTVERLAGALNGDVCGRLPAPSLLEPGLLIPKPDELQAAGPARSCEELALADLQSPTINPHMAVWLDYYLHCLLFDGGLSLCATYISLEVGAVRSVDTSAAAWGERLHRDPAFFLEPPVEEARESEEGEP